MLDTLDYPEIKNQLRIRLEEIGFKMDDWVINSYHSCPENHRCTIQGKEYDAYDYIYIINKNRRDVLYLWIDYAWTEGMETPLLYLCEIDAIVVDSPIDSFEDDIEKHFMVSYPSLAESTKTTENLFKKYHIHELPNFKEIVKRNVTEDQYNAIMKQKYLEKKKLQNSYKGSYAALNELLNEWDFVHVVKDEIDDEYTDLISPLLKLLNSGANENEIAASLSKEVTDRYEIRMNANDSDVRTFTKRILDWWRKK